MSNLLAGMPTVICFFCFDDFAWPSGDRVKLNKAFNDPEFKKCGKLQFPAGTSRDLGQFFEQFDCAYLTINGAFQPEVHLTAGEWQRWRLVQSAHESALRLDTPIMDGCEMWLLALDGAYLDSPREITTPLVLPAGARADIAVRCAVAGSYPISSLPAGFHTIGKTVEIYQPVIYPRLVATLVVAEALTGRPPEKSLPLPERLPLRPAAMSDLRAAHVDESFTVTYNLTGPGAEGGPSKLANGGQFSINGVSFRGRIEHCMRLGTIQEWTIRLVNE